MLKEFIFGSSFLVLFPFYLTVQNIPNTIKNYKYEDYTIIAPIYLGIMNILSKYLGKNIIGILSPTIVFLFSFTTNKYNFTKKQWIKYYFRILIRHYITFNVIIKYLESI